MTNKPSPAIMTTLKANKPTFTYQIVSYCLVFPIFRILLKGLTYGNENVPLNGPLVVVANHGSHLDPPLLGHALGRPLAFMAKQELFQIPLLGKIIRACGAYPVKRGASDREAIRIATARLEEGWATGVFLDGTRQKNGKVNTPMPGAALLSARSGAPLLPVAIINSHRVLGTGRLWPKLIPIHLRIGEPLPPPNSRKRNDLRATTYELQQRINAMLDEGLLSPREQRLLAHRQSNQAKKTGPNLEVQASHDPS